MQQSVPNGFSAAFLSSSQQASLDQPTQTVVMHRTEPTSLQNMALQLAEKLGSLVENNERVFDLKQGVYGGYFNRGEFRPLVTLKYFSKAMNAMGFFFIPGTSLIVPLLLEVE